MIKNTHKEEEQNMKKNNSGNKVLFAIFAVVFAVVAVVMFVSNMDYLFSDPTDFEAMIEEEGEPVTGERVSIDVELVYDWYAEMEYKINGVIPAGTEKYCLVYLEEQDAFVSLTVKGKEDCKAIDKLISESDDYMSSEAGSLPKSVTFEGKLTTIDPEISKFYTDFRTQFISYYGGYGWIPEFYQVTIDTTETNGTILLLIGIMLLLAVFFGAAFVAAVKNEKKEKLQAAAAPAFAANTDGTDPVFGNMYNAAASQNTEDNTQQ